MKYKYILIVTLIFLIFSCQNDEYKMDNASIRPILSTGDKVYNNENFKEYIDDQHWPEIELSDYNIAVKLENGKLILANPVKKESFFNLPDGKLEIIDNGEFGGALNFISNQVSIDTVQIWDGSVDFVFNFQEKFYFMIGSNHLMDSGGILFELKRINNTFTYDKVLKLDSAPLLISIYENKILIVGASMFTVIEDFKKRILLKIFTLVVNV